MHRTALLAALVSLPVCAADLQALIITGAADKLSAMKLFDAASKKAEPLSKLLTFAPGFPKLDESAAVKGLKPGFFIMVAGYCPDDSLLAAVKAIDPGAYVKPVQVDAAACPVLASGWSVLSAEAKDKDKRVLRGTLFQSSGDESWQLFLSLRDKAGVVVLERATDEYASGGCLSGGDAKLYGRGGSLVVKTTDCSRPRGCPNPGAATTSVTFTGLADRITDELTVLKEPGYQGCSGE